MGLDMLSPLTLFIAITAALVALVAFRPELTRARGGKILAFVALFILPVLASWTDASEHLERSKRTSFCLSCHVMTDYGRSLYVDDKSYLPAAHFQNHRVPPDQACYTCHTDYTMYGGVKAKLRGLRHVYIQYLGTIPKPEEIRLYAPYNNRECLHCHVGARSFEASSTHHKTPNMMADIMSNRLSCISSNCHDIVHDVATLKDATFWKPNR